MKKRNLILLTGLLVLSLMGCESANTNGTDVGGPGGDEDSAITENVSTENTTEAAVPEDIALKDVYAAHGMKVGTCITPQMIDNKAYCETILKHFNSVTMENAMKPDYIFDKEASISSGQLVVKFNKDAIKIMDFAKENNLSMRGHTLVWYSQTPEWIFHEDFNTSKPLVSRDVMLERMDSYMQQVFALLEEGGYSDMFYAYDVVNEAWMENGTMRDNNWKTIIGEDYLWQAFYYANKYAPENIALFYNDYNEQFKTGTLVDFVETLVDEDGNYLIDGIGLQAHLYTEDDLNQYFNTVETLGLTGLKIEITELDVSLGAWQKTLPGTDENLKVQGRYYYDLVSGIFERVDAGKINMDSFTFWGFADHLSWRKAASPLLFDSLNKPKYAFYGALQLKDFAGFDN